MGTHKPHSARQRPPPPTPTNMESYRHSNDQVADDKSNVLAAVSTFFMTQSGAKDAKTPTVAEAKLTFTDLNLPLMAALTAKQTKIAASTAAKYVGLIKVLKTKAKKDIKDKTTLTTEEEKTKIADFDKMDDAAKAAKETDFATEEKAKESLSLEQAAALLKAAKLHKGTFVFNADKSIDFSLEGDGSEGWLLWRYRVCHSRPRRLLQGHYSQDCRCVYPGRREWNVDDVYRLDRHARRCRRSPRPSHEHRWRHRRDLPRILRTLLPCTVHHCTYSNIPPNSTNL